VVRDGTSQHLVVVVGDTPATEVTENRGWGIVCRTPGPTSTRQAPWAKREAGVGAEAIARHGRCSDCSNCVWNGVEDRRRAGHIVGGHRGTRVRDIVSSREKSSESRLFAAPRSTPGAVIRVTAWSPMRGPRWRNRRSHPVMGGRHTQRGPHRRWG